MQGLLSKPLVSKPCPSSRQCSLQASTRPCSAGHQIPRAVLGNQTHCTCGSFSHQTACSSSRPFASRLSQASAARRSTRCRVSEAEAAWASAKLKGAISEIRADPQLAPLLDDPAIAAAVQEVAGDPAALSKYANKPKVMAVLSRLADKGLTPRQAAAFQEAGTSAGDLLSSMAAQPELAALLSQPAVREALSRIRAAADPAAEVEAACATDPRVARALDLLESCMGGSSGGSSGSSSSSAGGSGRSRRGQDGPVIAVEVPDPGKS